MDPLRKIYEDLSDWKRTDEKHPDHRSITAQGWQHIGSYKHSSGKIIHHYGNQSGKRLELDHKQKYSPVRQSSDETSPPGM